MTAKDIEVAVDQAKKGMPKGDSIIYADDSTSGLQLRVQGKRAFWSLKYGDYTKTIGFAFADKEPHRILPSITEARELAAEAKKVLDNDHRKFESFLSVYYSLPKDKKTNKRNVEDARREARGQVTTWTLRQCFEFMIEDRQRPDAQEPVKKGRGSSLQEWDLLLRRPQMQTLLDTPAASLTRGDFDDARKEIREIGVEPANKAMSNVRSCLSYCLQYAPGKSGLDSKDQWWQLLARGGKSNKRTRTPTVDDIVRILILAQEYLDKPLPGRTDAKHGIRANVFAALWWLVLTAQRTSAALHLERNKLFPDKNENRLGPDWYLASWPPDVTKAGVEHVLPIPPRVANFMLRLIDAAKTNGSQWAFPSERGNDEKDIPVNDSSVRLFIYRLAARDVLSKDKNGKRKKGFIDFFEMFNIPWWTPHDLRRSIGKVLDKEGIPGGASAVLAHKIKIPEGSLPDKRRADWLEQHVEDITSRAYHDPVRMQLKAKAMQVWTDAILNRYRELKGYNEDYLVERKAGIIGSYVIDDIAGLANAVDLARQEYRKQIADLKAQITEEQEAFEAAKSELSQSSEIAEKTVIQLRAASASLKRLQSDLAELQNTEVDQILQLTQKYEADFAISVAGVNLKLRKFFSNIDREFSAGDHFNVERDAPEYYKLKRQYISGEIGYDKLRREAYAAYNIEDHADEPVSQDDLRKQLAAEFGIEL